MTNGISKEQDTKRDCESRKNFNKKGIQFPFLLPKMMTKFVKTLNPDVKMKTLLKDARELKLKTQRSGLNF
jgi:hypothetical protein